MTDQGDDWGYNSYVLEHDMQAMENKFGNASIKRKRENTRSCLGCGRSDLDPKVDGWDSKHGFYCTGCWQRWDEAWDPTPPIPLNKLGAEAADIVLKDAVGQGENDFKIPLARRTLTAVLSDLTKEASR